MRKKLFVLLAAIVCSLTLYSQGRTFTWQGLSLTYPSNYMITDKEFDGETYSFCCEIKNDDIAMINFSMVKNNLFAVGKKEDLIDVAKESIEEIGGDMRKQFSGLTLGKTQVNRDHRYVYVYRNFTGKLVSIPIYGKVIVMANGNKYVCMVLQAESQSYLSKLVEIVNTVRIDK